MGSVSRLKGNKFENTVCRMLSAWVTGKPVAHMRHSVFRRRSTSITPVTGHWEGAGDILHQPGIAWPFCVEAKCVEEWEMDGAFKGRKWLPWKWWKQAGEEANITSLFPLLIYARNFSPIYAMMDIDVFRGLAVPVGVKLLVPAQHAVICTLDMLVQAPAKRVEQLWLGLAKQ